MFRGHRGHCSTEGLRDGKFLTAGRHRPGTEEAGLQFSAQQVGGSGGPVDDVDTRVCVDDAGHLTDRKRKRRVLEGLLHGAATECAEVAAAPAQSGHSNMSVTEFQRGGTGQKTWWAQKKVSDLLCFTAPWGAAPAAIFKRE